MDSARHLSSLFNICQYLSREWAKLSQSAVCLSCTSPPLSPSAQCNAAGVAAHIDPAFALKGVDGQTAVNVWTWQKKACVWRSPKAEKKFRLTSGVSIYFVDMVRNETEKIWVEFDFHNVTMAMSGIPIQISPQSSDPLLVSARKWPWPSSTISSCCSWTSSTINKRRYQPGNVGMWCKTTWVPNQEVGPLKLHIETPEVRTLNHQKWVQWRTVQPSRRIDFPEIIGFFLVEKWIWCPAGTHSKDRCSTGSCSLRCIFIWFYMIFEGSSHLTESMDFGKP